MVSEKRRKINRANLAEFFSPIQFVAEDKSKALDVLPPKELINFMRYYLKNHRSIEDILSYARRYKKAVDELEVEDIEAVKNILAVKEIMNG